jgi:acyl-CoA synthetase (AMP-forming)/AMP-acid ligase II
MTGRRRNAKLETFKLCINLSLLTMSDVPTFSVLWEYLEHWSRVLPTQEAVVFKDRRISYEQLNDAADLFAKALISFGVRKGDRVGTLLNPGPEFLIAFFGSSKIGAVTVPFDVRYKKDEIQHLCTIAQPKVIVCGDQASAHELAEVQPSLEIERFVLSGGCELIARGVTFEEVLRDRRMSLSGTLEQMKNGVHENDDLMIVFTGGTTGVPKGARLSHKNFISMNVRAHEVFNLNHSDRLLVHLPPSHVGGVMDMMTQSLVSGITMVILEHFRPDSTLELIEKEKVTIFGQVPTMFAMEFELPNFYKYELSTVRLILAAGEMTSPELMAKILSLGKPFGISYGCTEADGVTYTRPEDTPEKLMGTGYVGKPLRDVEVRVVDEERRTAAAMQHGEIAIRGPTVCKEYYKMPEETAASFDDEGWFYTGDIGYLDNDGGLYLVGRKKQIIRTGSYTVLPKELEEVLAGDPRVLLASVVGVPDSRYGEVAWAFVVPKQGASVTSDELRSLCSDRLADYKVPRKVIIRDSLPATRLGKIAIAQLKEEAIQLKLAESKTQVA